MIFLSKTDQNILFPTSFNFQISQTNLQNVPNLFFAAPNRACKYDHRASTQSIGSSLMIISGRKNDSQATLHWILNFMVRWPLELVLDHGAELFKGAVPTAPLCLVTAE